MANNDDKINKQAEEHFNCPSKKLLNALITNCIPLIKKRVNKTCQEGKWDRDDLYSDLLKDTWELIINKYDPKRGKFLIFLQISLTSSIRNWVSNQKREKNKVFSESCELTDNIPSIHTKGNLFNQIQSKDLVEKLTKAVENDPKLLAVLNALQQTDIVFYGHVKQTAEELNLHYQIVRYRIQKLKKILKEL